MQSTLYKIFSPIYVFAWIALAGSICISEFATSTAFIMIAGAWFFCWDWEDKWYKLKNNWKPIFGVVGVFLVFIYGLGVTNNWAFAGADINRKLPIFSLPILLVTGPGLTRKQVNWVLFTLGGMAIFTTVLGTCMYQFGGAEGALSHRDLSPFISLIRVSLVMVFFVAYCFWLIIRTRTNLKWLLLLPIAWIVFYLVKAQSLTGLVTLFVLATSIFIWKAFQKSKWIGWLVILTNLSIGIYLYHLTSSIAEIVFNKPTKTSFTEKTANGNLYREPRDSTAYENGHYTWRYFNSEELGTEWDKYQDVKFADSLNGYPLYVTIVRYMTWKGFTKDSLGYHQLSQEDIAAIKAGHADPFLAKHSGLKARLYLTLWEFKKQSLGHNLFDNSVAYRTYLWSIGWEIFKENWLLGTGTGDVQDAFNEKYMTTYKSEADKNRRRAHNQYLTVALSVGIIGFSWFIYSFLYPLLKHKNGFFFLTCCFFLVYGLGMFWEDSLESQAGASIYGLIVSILFFPKSKKKSDA